MIGSLVNTNWNGNWLISSPLLYRALSGGTEENHVNFKQNSRSESRDLNPEPCSAIQNSGAKHSIQTFGHFGRRFKFIHVGERPLLFFTLLTCYPHVWRILHVLLYASLQPDDSCTGSIQGYS